MKPDFFSRPLFQKTVPGYTVPHDRIGLRYMMIVHQAISKAFELLRADGHSMTAKKENDITERLEDFLVNRVYTRGEVEGFDTFFFGRVIRANELVNFDGTKKSKKPDLVFPLRRENRQEWDQRQDAVFVECKPIDHQHSLKGHYCAVGKDCTGIERFIIGDYAWAMEEVFMVGYARGGITIALDLQPVLADVSRHRELGSPSNLEALEEIPLNSKTDRLHRTIHQRLFRWNNGEPASPIEIFHSWHDCN